MESPTFDLADFLTACATGTKAVVVLGDAEKDAEMIFGIVTRKDVLAFIANGGLKELRFLNTSPYFKEDGRGLKKVDAYDFYTGNIHGYISFGFNPSSSRWILKSFHRQLETRAFELNENLRRLEIGKDGYTRFESR